MTTNDDLGHGWELARYSDGSARVRNTRTGSRIDLPAESVQRLKAIIRRAENPTAGQVYGQDGTPMREG